MAAVCELSRRQGPPCAQQGAVARDQSGGRCGVQGDAVSSASSSCSHPESQPSAVAAYVEAAAARTVASQSAAADQMTRKSGVEQALNAIEFRAVEQRSATSQPASPSAAAAERTANGAPTGVHHTASRATATQVPVHNCYHQAPAIRSAASHRPPPRRPPCSAYGVAAAPSTAASVESGGKKARPAAGPQAGRAQPPAPAPTVTPSAPAAAAPAQSADVQHRLSCVLRPCA